MRKFIKLVALSLLVVAIVPMSGAQSVKKVTKAAPKAVACPVCHMPLAKKKSKADPVAVRLKKGGPVLYCCAGCKMPASVLVKTAKPKAKAKAKAK